MRIRKRKEPWPLSSLCPVPLSELNFRDDDEPTCPIESSSGCTSSDAGGKQGKVLDLKNKLKVDEAQRKELTEMLAENAVEKKEVQRKHEHDEAHKKELEQKLELMEAQKKELQHKLDRSEFQMKQFHQNIGQSESQKKEFKLKHGQSEAQRKELQQKLESMEAQKKELQHKLNRTKEMEQNQAHERGLQKKKQLEKQLQVMAAGHKIVEEATKRHKMSIPAIECLIPVNEIFYALTPEQVFISEEDRVLFRLYSARQFLKLQDQPRASNATDKAKETVRTWLSRDLETYSPEENFRELKEALEFLHVQNLLPEDLVRTFRKMFDSIHDHLDQYCKEKEELHKSTRSDHGESLSKIKDGVQMCEPYEAELQEYNFRIVKLEGELAALRQGKAEVVKKIQGVMKVLEPIQRKLEEDAARADQVRLKRSKLDTEVVHFRSLDKPKVDEFSLRLSKQCTYDGVLERVALQLGLDDSYKIRLRSHDCYTQKPRSKPIDYCGVECLTNMLVFYNRTSDILYYEVFPPKTLEVAFRHATKDKVVVNTIRLPREKTVWDLINDLKAKVELSHSDAEIRLLNIGGHRIIEVFPYSKKIQYVHNLAYATLRAEEVPKEEKNLGPNDHIIAVCHFTESTTKNNPTIKNFGEPFLFVVREGETLAEIKVRIQKKLQVPSAEFSTWKFAYVQKSPVYLQDSDNVHCRFDFVGRENVGDFDHICYHYLGLEHSDRATRNSAPPNKCGKRIRVYAAN